MSLFNKHICLFFLFVTCLTVSTVGQSRKELERKKSSLKKDIAYKNKLLKQTTKKKKNSLSALVLLNKKINERAQLIGTIKSEINLLSEEILDKNTSITKLKVDIQNLKDEYAQMIRFAYKNKSNYDRIMFVFAADDFNEAFKRLKYLQEYAEYRKRQTEAMIRMEAQLVDELIALEEKKKLKVSLLETEKEQRKNLSSEKQQQQEIYKQLQQKEKQLKKQIRRKEKERLAIQKALERVIANEIRKSKKKNRSKTWKLTPEAKALSTKFETNKGKLPWPVTNGVITEKFGVHAHPVLRTIKVKNNGVSISTEKDAIARAVFKGEVSGVIVINGAGKAIIIRHGNYFTVYGNLSETFVSNGDKVETKQSIGKVNSDQGKTVIQFEIRKGQEAEPMNPSYWLYNAR